MATSKSNREPKNLVGCNSQQPELPETAQVQPVEQPNKTRTLFAISDDLEKLNELLDQSSDDVQYHLGFNKRQYK